MVIYDRDYAREGGQDRGRYSPQMRMTFPQLTPMVKRLLIINISVFFAGIVFFPANASLQIGTNTIAVSLLEKWFAVIPNSFISILQVWRLVTYQFLHGSIMHILFNMIGLFFLGPTLERSWGGKKFLIFYLGCGVAGGLFYTFLAVIGFLTIGLMVGASGAILGMLAACAILFPHFVVFFLFFPIPIRIAAVILTLLYLANLLMVGKNAGGDAAHIAGMAAGAAYVLSQSWRDGFKSKMRTDQWEKKAADQQNLQIELDRILQKVHESGIHSLTQKEKKVLKRATQAQRTQK